LGDLAVNAYLNVAIHSCIAFGVIYGVSVVTATAPTESQAEIPPESFCIIGPTAITAPVKAASRIFQPSTSDSCKHQTSDATNGIAELLSGDAELAVVHGELSAEESQHARERGINLESLTIGSGGVAIVVHPTVARVLPSLSLEQLTAIFVTGKTRRWEDVCGNKISGEIEVKRYPLVNSASQVLLHALAADASDFIETASELESCPAMVKEISRRPRSIGFVWNTYPTDGLAALPLDFQGIRVSCNEDSIRSNRYPFVQDIAVVCNRECPAGIRFLTFLGSVAGQQALNNAGLVTAMSFESPSHPAPSPESL
jgi:ABC-type phosphate transport system substrate-binding protein